VDHRLHDGLRALTDPAETRPYTDEELATLRELLPASVEGQDWPSKFEGEMPPEVAEVMLRTFDAYVRGDIDALLRGVHPDVEIVQPKAFVDARTYSGHRGLVEALLDWPLQWEHLEIEPQRLFVEPAPGGGYRVFSVAIHRGHSHAAGIDVEAEVVWVNTYVDGLLTRWDMYMSLEEARAELDS
jgi:ketosteroid isomerase-like protein